MTEKIHAITLRLPLGLGKVNAYLLESSHDFLLIDTGPPSTWKHLQLALDQAECSSTALRLIVLTHGDFDHTGSACRLRRDSGAPIAIHRLDAPMLCEGDMFSGRKSPNYMIRWATPRLLRFGPTQRCVPDIHLEDGSSLLEYGFDAQIIHLPGHSSGSIGILTSEGSFFCGDLLENRRSPSPNTMIDDASAFAASMERIRGKNIKDVYPGHGDPFSMEAFQAANPLDARDPR